MHLLRSTVLGTEVIDAEDHHVQGVVADLLIDTDRGKILALLIKRPFARELLALQEQDIISWGQRVHIRQAEVLGPLNEVVRLQPYLEDKRPIIGQRIRTKSGVKLGRCSDFQLNPETRMIEWIFPRKFFRKGLALPASDILEITPQAIIVKDQGPKGEEVVVEEEAKPEIKPVISPALGRSNR